jgi:hypothetical protein
MEKTNLFYYSTNSYLSYLINERFYKGLHYVWCSPCFDPSKLGRGHIFEKIPPSSNPSKIYLQYLDGVKNGDRHNDRIKNNKKALKRGAAIQAKNGVIDQYNCEIIIKTINDATLEDFTPLLYIIPSALVNSRVQPVGPKEMANPLGVEFKIVDLRNNEFEFIEFPA